MHTTAYILSYILSEVITGCVATWRVELRKRGELKRVGKSEGKLGWHWTFPVQGPTGNDSISFF